MRGGVKSARLPGYVRDLLASCPSSGTGVHQWLFRCALVLHKFLPEAEIAPLLEAASAGCGRTLEPHEIPDAIRNSKIYAEGGLAAAGNPATAATATGLRGHWPKPNLEQIEALALNGIHLVDLWERSPVRIEGDGAAEWLIDRLFPGNPLLCCGLSSHRFGTATREEWRGDLSRLSFIVPNPMTAERGGRKNDGKLSPRTLDNTGGRMYLVAECDFSTTARDGVTPTIYAPLLDSLQQKEITVADMCAATLWRLSELAPLAMVVHSGGKSLHGWFPCAGQPEERLRRFMRYAASLGADPATWSRCQLVRMPEGLRRFPDGLSERQRVYYFNPEVLQ